jgi:hypothetical protein
MVILRTFLVVLLVLSSPLFAETAAPLNGSFLCQASSSYLPNNTFDNATNGSMTRNITCDEQIQNTLDSFATAGLNETTSIKLIKGREFCTENISEMPWASPVAENLRVRVVNELKNHFGPSCCGNELSICSETTPSPPVVENIDIAFAAAMCKNIGNYIGSNLAGPTTGNLTCDQGVHLTLVGISPEDQQNLRLAFALGEAICTYRVPGKQGVQLNGLINYMKTTAGPHCCSDRTSVCGKAPPSNTPARIDEDDDEDVSGSNCAGSGISLVILGMGVVAGLTMIP